MRRRPIIAGIAAGAIMGLGGVVTADLATQSAEAQPPEGQTAKQVGSAELQAANQRSQAAIRLAKDLQNHLGKYLQPEGQLIGANPPPPPIRQDRGTGDGGLPTEVIKDAAITSSKLANASVNTEKIAPGGVTSTDLASNAVQTANIASGAVTESRLSTDLANGLAYFAHVTGNAVLEGNRGFTGAAGTPEGAYELTTGFPVSTENCAVQVTPDDNNSDFGYYGKYEITGTNSIIVRIYYENGALDNEPFSITVHCV